eukprot:9895108-Alexandrium_andersonii.AAC.1
MDDRSSFAASRLREGAGVHEASQVGAWLRRRMAGLVASADQLRAEGLRGGEADQAPGQDRLRPYSYLEDYVQEVIVASSPGGPRLRVRLLGAHSRAARPAARPPGWPY